MTDLSGGQQSGARSLAALFKRDYKWPNPEASSGKKIGNMGRQQCYEAVGPAREEFDILAREISEFLENCTESVSANVSWSLYMFGKSRESSRPQIAFCSPEREARRSVRKSVTRSGILERHPGFSTMDCSRPPEFVSPIVSLAEDGMELELTGSNLSYTIFVQPRSSSAIGADLSVLTNGGSIQDRRTATAGGILVWDERHFLMTAGHIFGNDTRSTFSTSNTNDDLEFDFDEIDDSEGDEALSTSRGSMTSTSTTSDSLDIKASSSSTGSQEMQTATPSTSSTRNEIKTLKIPKVPKELWGEGNRVGHRHRPLNDTTKGEDASNEMESLKEVTFKELDLKKEMPCQADLMEENSDEAQSTQLHNDSGPFQGPFISSSDGSHSSLDYALIEITGSNLAKRNSLVVNDESASREVLIQGVARNGCSASDVLVVTSRGIMRGQMSGTPTYLQPAYSTNQQELWTVSLYGELEKGDCGAWVIDAKTGLLYGHLIAGTLASGSAYIVPLWQVFDDLHQLLGGQWWLAGEIPQHHNQPRVFSEEIFDGKSSQPNDKREVLLHDLASTTTSVSKQQPMQPRVIENFLQFLDRPENRFLGIRGKGLEIEHPFIPSRILELELAKPMGLKSLIQATFPEESEFALRLALIRECYLKVFCILLKLGRGSDIQILMGDNSYSDVDLPFDFHQLPDSRKGFLPDDLIEPFHQQQWAFCAPKFQHKTDSSFKSEQILPITAVEKLGDGGSAVVYKIKIHEAYDELIGNRGKVIVKHLYVFIC